MVKPIAGTKVYLFFKLLSLVRDQPDFDFVKSIAAEMLIYNGQAFLATLSKIFQFNVMQT